MYQSALATLMMGWATAQERVEDSNTTYFECYTPKRGVVPPASFNVICDGKEVTYNNFDVGWIDDGGCEVYTPKNSVEKGGEYMRLVSGLEGYYCPSTSARPLNAPQGECERLSYCKYEIDCEYTDYVELCDVDDIFQEKYLRNCLVVAELAFADEPTKTDSMCDPPFVRAPTGKPSESAWTEAPSSGSTQGQGLGGEDESSVWTEAPSPGSTQGQGLGGEDEDWGSAAATLRTCRIFVLVVSACIPFCTYY